MKATVLSTHDCGAPETLRDENGEVWSVVSNPGTGQLAVEQVYAAAGHAVRLGETVGMAPCRIATWQLDGTLEIGGPISHGENYTDPAEFDDGAGVWTAGPNGWEGPE